MYTREQAEEIFLRSGQDRRDDAQVNLVLEDLDDSEVQRALEIMDMRAKTMRVAS